MREILIKDTTLLTMSGDEPILEDASLLIRDDRIAALGPAGSCLPGGDDVQVLDGSDHLVMPGFVNCHTHTPMTMVRGLGDEIEAVNWLPVNWTVTSRFDDESTYQAARLAVAEMIASGTTCFNDNYPHCSGVARAAEELGLRAEIGHGIGGKFGRRQARRQLQQAVDFAEEWHGRGGGRIRARLSPHALYTTPSEIVLESRRAANDLGIGMNMHVAETQNEMRFVKDPLGPTSVQHLHTLGVLGPDFVIAHGLTVSEEDLDILAEAGTGIAHCPQAVAKMGGRDFPNIVQWMQKGVKTGLGTDGVGSNNDADMIEEMRFAALVRKMKDGDARVLPAKDILRVATMGGAEVLGLEDEIGSLEVGKKADLIMIDLKQPHLTPRHNIRSHLVYSAHGADVDTVIVDGEILYKDRQFTRVDLDEVLLQAQETFEGLLGKAGWKVTMMEPEQGHVAALKQSVARSALGIFTKLIQPDEGEG